MKRNDVKLSPLATAVLLAMGTAPVFGQEFLDIEDLVNPQSSVRAGVGYIDGDNRWYGRYHGLVDTTEKGAVPLLDLEYVTRDPDTGTWAKAKVGPSGAQFEYGPQGDWSVSVEAQRIETQEIPTFTTGLRGFNSNDMTEVDITAATGNPAAAREVDFEMERTDLKFEATKQLPNDFDVRFSFRNHDKEGQRQWGNGPGGPFFVAEPIDYNIKEMEAVVGYTGDAMQLAGGVYGTAFDNGDNVANFSGGVSNWDQMSIPLDNESYQLFLNGAYRFAGSTNANFKVSYTHATQDDDFFTTPTNICAAPGATDCVDGNDLDAEVNTTLAYAALSSRPMDNLSITANLRWEDRDDDTDEQFFLLPATPTRTRPNTNVAHSRENLTSKLEATYLLPMGISLVGGVEYDELERSNPNPSSVRYADTEETSYRVELRKSMHETINGSVSYTYSDRDSDDQHYSANPQADWVAPIHMTDRERDKYKVSVDWVPSSPLSIQFVYEYTDDDYDTGIADFGTKSGSTELVSLDAAYRVNEDWTVNGWISRDETKYDRDQGSPSGSGGLVDPWSSNLKYKGDSIGLGVRGLVMFQHRVGADIQYGKDKAEYGINDPVGGASDLPDTEYKYTRIHLFGEYVFDDFSGLRADYVYTKFENDEWAWDDWVYADGTTVELEDDEDVNFIGLSYYYKWR